MSFHQLTRCLIRFLSHFLSFANYLINSRSILEEKIACYVLPSAFPSIDIFDERRLAASLKSCEINK